MRGKKTLLKNHMMPPVQDKPPEKPQPEPISPPPSAERPPVTDASTDDGSGSESTPGTPEGAMDNDTLILIGLGALLLFSYGMVK